MGRILGGGALLLLSLFLLVGFVRSGASIGAPATLAALLVGVALPALGGIALLRGRLRGGGRKQVEQLRRQTLEAEILRFAQRHAGRLTAVEVAGEFAITQEEAKATLDDLVTREIAELEITDDGVLVYEFFEARHLDGKHGARGLLDA